MKVGYVRVSTREQDEGNALDQQTARVVKAGAAIIFSDVESGRSDKRKEFNKLISQCKAGKITEVICTRIDRLGRTVGGITKAMLVFEKHNIKLTMLDSPVNDPSSPFGWFSINQMAGLAELESRLLADRIKNGMNYFREQKKASSRPPYGYCRIDEKYAPSLEDGKWEIALETIKFFLNDGTLRSTIKFLLENYSVSWTPAGLKYWLTNPVLRGHTPYNVRKEIVIHEDTHEALISEHIFKQITRKLNENKSKYCYGRDKKHSETFPLTGQIICDDCGYKCFCKKRNSTYRVRCKKHESLGDNFCKNKVSSYLQDIILAVDEALVLRHKEIKEYAKLNLGVGLNEDVELLRRQEQLRQLNLLPKSQIIQDAINQTILEINNIKQKEVLEDKVNDELLDILSFCCSNINFWEETPWTDKALIYQELVQEVRVNNGKITGIKLLV